MIDTQTLQPAFVIGVRSDPWELHHIIVSRTAPADIQIDEGLQ